MNTNADAAVDVRSDAEAREALPEGLSPEAEAHLIRQAQDHSQAEQRANALATLYLAYRPVILATRKRYREHLDRDDLDQELYAAFLEVVETHDVEASPRLAGRISQMLTNALDRAVSTATNAWSIPPRTLQRFYGILRRADGDLERAAELAPEYLMPTETFLWIAHLLRKTGSLTPAPSDDGDERENNNVAGIIVGSEPRDAYEDADDHLLAQAALRSLPAHQREIVEYAYGFTPVVIDGVTVDPVVPDRVIGHLIGKSRLYVLRQRNAALATMREALGL